MFCLKNNYSIFVKFMKSIISLLLSTIIFLASFQNSLFYVDYQLNTAYYEALCINKQKPELQCNGKCQVKSQSEKESSPISEIKYSFELNILPSPAIELKLIKPFGFNTAKKIISPNPSFTLEGYGIILPDPPQNLG
jgi:hypothetical protein